MGKKGEFKKVNLFIGIIYSEPEIIPPVIDALVKNFSKAELVSDEFEFNFTSYYNREMGLTLFRKFISFKNLIDPTELSGIKIFTNEIEQNFSINGKRQVNLDPGYLSDSNVIIATTKNHYHRIPLRDGIYAHMEYIFKKREINTLEWTYPDFRSEHYKRFFSELFELYRRKVIN